MDIQYSTEQRREKLRSHMRMNNLDALIVYYAANRYYLSGFELHDPQYNESAGCLVVTASGRDWICTDARYIDTAKRIWDEDRIYEYKGNTAEQIADLVRKLFPNGGAIGYEERVLTVSFFKRFSQKIGSALDLIPIDGMIERLRCIKDPHEIVLIKNSYNLNHKLMDWVPSILTPQESEASVAWKIESFFRESGATEIAFPSIVACGPNAALPHAIPSKETMIELEDLVLVDVGARLDSYCSDQTRTFWVGNKPKKRFTEALNLVQEAQQQALKAAYPGAMIHDVYMAAYKYFEKYGVEKHFIHSLGHGLGLDVHEAPSIRSGSKEVLEPGMVFTVEPGLYYPEWGGIRWEHLALVEEDTVRFI